MKLDPEVGLERVGELDILPALFVSVMIPPEVEREFGGNKFVIKYAGKIQGDTITGESENPGRDGETMKREWVAKRAK